MPLPAIIALIIGAWIMVAVLVAIILGRTAAAGEHERRLGSLQRDARHASAPRHHTQRSTIVGHATKPQ